MLDCIKNLKRHPPRPTKQQKTPWRLFKIVPSRSKRGVAEGESWVGDTIAMCQAKRRKRNENRQLHNQAWGH